MTVHANRNPYGHSIAAEHIGQPDGQFGHAPQPGHAPEPGHPGHAGDQLLGHELRTHELVHDAVCALRDWLHDRSRPARLCDPIVMTAAQPIDWDQTGHPSLSIGVLNPTTVPIYWGIGGAVPQPGQRAIAQPAKSLMVLPLSAQDLSIGADPALLGAATAVVFLMRFDHVMAPFLGATV